MSEAAGAAPPRPQALSWGESPDAPELSVRTANMVTLYFERTYGRDRLLEVWRRHEVPLPLSHFRDHSRFVSLRFVERLTEVLLEESGDPDFVHQAGLFVAKPEATGFLFYVMKAIGTPRLGFQKMVELGPTFNRVGRFEIEALERRRTVLTYRSDLPEQNRNMCVGRMAQFSALPTVWGVPPARVIEHACQVRGADACRYEFEWEEPAPRWQIATGAVLGLTAFVLFLIAGMPVRAVLAALVAILGGMLLEARVLLGRRNEQLAAQNRGLTESLADLERMNAELSARVDARTAELSESNLRLESALQQRQELDRLKQEFFDNVSHELRTPLTLILLPLHAVLHEGKYTLNPSMRAELEVLERNAQQLLSLINQLLDLARFDSKKVRLRVEPFGIRALLENVVRGFSTAAAARGQTLELVGEELDPLWVDVERLESVFQNLLANALKFTPDGGRVTVRIVDLDERVQVSVEDNGIGIAQEDLPRIFERFSQAESLGNRQLGGTGIGLALVKEVLQLHGGTVSVQSELERGSVFTVTLRKGEGHLPDAIRERRTVQVPVMPERRATRQLVGDRQSSAFVAPDPVADLTDAPGAPSEERVLIVEDNPELRTSLVRILSPHFRVLAAADGGEGWRIAHEERPSLIVSDVMMPGISGIELLRRIRASPELSDLPVLLLTARRNLPSLLEGFEAGASDYLPKPFAPSELLARVEAQLKLRSAAVRAAEHQRLAMLGLLTSGFAHEVRNPLNGLLNVIGPLKEMLEEAKVEGAGDLVLVAEECGERLRQLTQSLLNFARGDQPAGPVDLEESLSAALRIVEWQLPGNVRIARAGGGTSEAPLPTIHGDASALDQVWLNLFDNAVRAMPEGGLLEVITGVRDRFVVVTLRDTGVGISPADLPRVFEPFFSTRPAGQGTGLGLAICRRIVLRHGGDLRIRSTPGEGTEVEVSLPLTPPFSAPTGAA